MSSDTLDTLSSAEIAVAGTAALEVVLDGPGLTIGAVAVVTLAAEAVEPLMRGLNERMRDEGRGR